MSTRISTIQIVIEIKNIQQSYRHDRLTHQFMTWQIFHRGKRYSQNCQQISGIKESRKSTRAYRLHIWKLFQAWRQVSIDAARINR